MKWVIIVVLLLIAAYLVSKSLKRALTVAAGFGLYTFSSDMYDKILWPIVQGRYGLKGAVAMSVGAMVMNFSLLVVYQRCGVDWLGVSLLDDLRQRADRVHASLKLGTVRDLLLRPPVMAMQGAMWMLRTPWSAFLLLTMWEDSFVTTAFLRQGRFGPLEKRDLVVFTASTVLSCVTWSIWSGAIVASVKALWISLGHT